MYTIWSLVASLLIGIQTTSSYLHMTFLKPLSYTSGSYIIYLDNRLKDFILEFPTHEDNYIIYTLTWWIYKKMMIPNTVHSYCTLSPKTTDSQYQLANLYFRKLEPSFFNLKHFTSCVLCLNLVVFLHMFNYVAELFI